MVIIGDFKEEHDGIVDSECGYERNILSDTFLGHWQPII